MKISIKKKYVLTVVSLLCIGLGYWHIIVLFEALHTYGIIGLIYPILFLTSLVWTVLYLKELKDRYMLAEDVARKIADDDKHIYTERTKLETIEEVKDYLQNRVFEESYTINIVHGKIKFTSSWVKQKELEEVRQNKIPKNLQKNYETKGTSK